MKVYHHIIIKNAVKLSFIEHVSERLMSASVFDRGRADVQADQQRYPHTPDVPKERGHLWVDAESVELGSESIPGGYQAVRQTETSDSYACDRLLDIVWGRAHDDKRVEQGGGEGVRKQKEVEKWDQWQFCETDTETRLRGHVVSEAWVIKRDIKV